jgi:hypothetical protein
MWQKKPVATLLAGKRMMLISDFQFVLPMQKRRGCVSRGRQL